MNVIIIDMHLSEDGRIAKHIKFLRNTTNLNIYHLHVNYRQNLPEGRFSYFGEYGYRINIPNNYSNIILNVLRLLYCNLKLRIFFPSIFDKLNIDFRNKTIVHIHDPFLLGIASMFKSKKYGDIKVVYDRHELYEKYSKIMNVFPPLDRLYEIFNRRFIDGVVTVSDEYIKNVKDLFPNTIVNFVPNYPSSEDYNSDLIKYKINTFKLNNELNFVYIGSLNNNFDRDIDLLLKIADTVLRSSLTYKFYIGGPSNSEDLLKKFRSMSEKYNERFHYMGYVSRDEIVRITQQSHIGFLLIKPDTSYWVKTSPNKVFEYLICGTIPIIRANIEKSDSIKSCGLIFDRNSSENEIIEKLMELLKSPQLIYNLMEKSRKLSDNYRWEVVANNYLNIYYCLHEDMHTGES